MMQITIWPLDFLYLLKGLEKIEDPQTFPTIADMARDAGMSIATFHRHFKAVTGHPPLHYFKRNRLLRAKSLLVFDGLSVSAAAQACGYANIPQFSRDFRKLFGKPPNRADELHYNL